MEVFDISLSFGSLSFSFRLSVSKRLVNMAPLTSLRRYMNKQTEVVFFSSTAIALYGYDQGMMSLINTNYDYLQTMGLAEEDPMVGVIVSVYYLGCAVGAVFASAFANAKGRRPGIFACLATASLGNLLTFIPGLGGMKGALTMILIGRIVMGLGVGRSHCSHASISLYDICLLNPVRWHRRSCACLLLRTLL